MHAIVYYTIEWATLIMLIGKMVQLTLAIATAVFLTYNMLLIAFNMLFFLYKKPSKHRDIQKNPSNASARAHLPIIFCS